MSDTFTELARELMKPNPIVQTSYIVRLTIEKVVQRESGVTHVQNVLESQILTQSGSEEVARASYRDHGGIESGVE